MIRFFLSAAIGIFALSYHVSAETGITVQNKAYNSGVVAVEWSELTVETAGSVLVKTGANVSFVTGDEILLKPGFIVQAGAIFSAKIQNPPTYNPDNYYTTSLFVFLIGGGNQFSLINTFNLQPFDIVVWNAAGTAPLANAPVLITIDFGSGWLSSGNTPTSILTKTLKANTDIDGSLLVYYKQGATPYEKATIRAIAYDTSLFIHTFSLSDGDLDGDGSADVNDLDADGDQMPNFWEAQYGLNPFLATSADGDGDGLLDHMEYLIGRNPTKGALPDSSGNVALRVFSPSL